MCDWPLSKYLHIYKYEIYIVIQRQIYTKYLHILHIYTIKNLQEVSSKKKVLDQKGSGEAGGKGQICDRNEEEVKYPQSQPTKKGAAKGFIFLSRI